MLIEKIEQKIISMEAGAFQNLCKVYLTRRNNKCEIVCLGGEGGTGKPTKGTPDIYYLTNHGKYVFVECTTGKSNLFTKICSDIMKCLDTKKTQVPNNNIEKIIYFHTSSNITVNQDMKLRALCDDQGIELEIIGIDTLSTDLLNYSDILRNELGISLDTEQILEYEMFISNYNSNKTTADLYDTFLFRTEEISRIDDCFNNHDITVLKGKSGVGKTRLGLEYARRYSEKNNCKLYCFQNKNISLFSDLKDIFSNAGTYFFLIDDANEFDELNNILEYVNKKDKQIEVKILLTVRDYVAQPVKDSLMDIAKYEMVTIESFSDREISEMIEKILNIKNEVYKKRIVEIAEGNARIAILAGKLACVGNGLSQINDVSQLYDVYYKVLLRDNDIPVDTSMCKTLAILAMFKKIDLSQISRISCLLDCCEISGVEFKNQILKLHALEIVDVYQGRAVVFSDQCFANYILKYTFYDESILSLHKVIRIFFVMKAGEYARDIVNMLLNIFISKEMQEFIVIETNKVWCDLEEENTYFDNFFEIFCTVRPTKSIVLLKNRIEKIEPKHVDITSLNAMKKNNYISIHDKILKVLIALVETEERDSALDLFFMYYKKRPDLYEEFYNGCKSGFGITKQYLFDGLSNQIALFSKLKEYSEGWENKFFIFLCFELLDYFLDFDFSSFEYGRGGEITYYDIPLTLTESVVTFRSMLWSYVDELGENSINLGKIRSLLEDYSTKRPSDKDVFAHDLQFIESIFKSCFANDSLDISLLASKLVNMQMHSNLDDDALLEDYLLSEDYYIYSFLQDELLYFKGDYDELRLKKEREISTILDENYSKEYLMKIIDVCKVIDKQTRVNNYFIKENLACVFKYAFLKKEFFLEIVEYYLRENTPMNISPPILIKLLIVFSDEKETLELLARNEFDEKDVWITYFYSEIPESNITQEFIDGFYLFLNNLSYSTESGIPFFNLTFLEKYLHLDSSVYVTVSDIIFSKFKSTPHIIQGYFSLIFNIKVISTEQLLMRFSDNYKLLEEVYFYMLEKGLNNDHKGEFLRKFYLIKKDILVRFVNCLFADFPQQKVYKDMCHCFYELDDFIPVYIELLNKIVEQSRDKIWVAHGLFKRILTNVSNDLEIKRDELIKKYIALYHMDRDKMQCVFNIVWELNEDVTKEAFVIFYKNNKKIEDFKKLPLYPTVTTFWGSAIPLQEQKIKILKEELLPIFVCIEGVEHKEYILDTIKELKEDIAQVELQEILEK